jgi:hypothetical protein
MGERRHRAPGLGVGLLALLALSAVLAACGIVDQSRAPASGPPAASSPEPSLGTSAAPGTSASPNASEPAPSADVFGPAKALLAAGYPGEAAAAARSALATAGATKPAVTLPPELQGLPGRDPLTGAISYSPVLASIWGFVLAYWPLIVLVVALMLIARRRMALSGRLEIGTIDDSASGSHIGPTLTGVISSEIDRMSDEGAGSSMDVASGSDQVIRVPDPVAVTSPTAGVIGAIAGLVGSTKGVLSGQVSPDSGAFGRNLILELKRPNGAVSSVTLPGFDFTGVPRNDLGDGDLRSGRPESNHSAGLRATKLMGRSTTVRKGASGVAVDERYVERTSLEPLITSKHAAARDQPGEAEILYLLALAGAAWVVYEIADPVDRSRLPSSDWRSFARTRVGAAIWQSGSPARARRLYLDALALDPTNRVAMFNLGSMDRNTDPDRAIQVLEKARSLILQRTAAQGDRRTDRLWYRVMYSLAAAHYNMSIRKADQLPSSAGQVDAERKGPHTGRKEPQLTAAEHRTKADGYSSTVVSDAVDRLEGRVDDSRPTPNEVAFLRTAMQVSLILLAAARRDRSHEPGTGRRKFANQKELRDQIDSLTSPEIIRYVCPDRTTYLPPRVAYSLACYYAEGYREHRDRADLDKSLYWLKRAFYDRNLITTSREDPTLASVVWRNGASQRTRVEWLKAVSEAD